jgi:GNAT superfamily N-acetyltransferase
MSEVLFRLATREDLASIVRMLADDELGNQRERYEDPLPETYIQAFEQINVDPNHELIVAELYGEVVGTLHLVFISSISFQGGLRAQVESVRIDEKLRGQGIGSKMMKWVIERCQSRGARLVQLTTYRSREDAHRFYERLGFSKSHIGMKLILK